MSITIRPVTVADAPEWQRMREDLWPGDDHAAEILAYFEGRCEEPEAVLFALDEAAQAVGFVELSCRQDVPGLEGEPTGYIEGLYVQPQARASGLTRELLRASQQWARARGCRAFASDRDDRVVIYPKFQNATAGPGAGEPAGSDSHRSS